MTRGLASALRAGFVIAGVIGEVLFPTVAGKDVGAQRGGAANTDRPNGAVLLFGKRRVGLEKLRQKTAQRLQDCRTLGHALVNEVSLGRADP